MTWPEVSTSAPTALAVGETRTRVKRLVRRGLLACYATAVAGGFGAALMPWGMTWPWLAALCGVVFVTWVGVGLRRDRGWLGRLELVLEHEPRHLVARGPWTTRTHTLDEVDALQLWCDCGAAGRALEPHRDGIDVSLRTGETFRVEPAKVFAADVGATLRELLESSGVKVVDWGGADVDRA